MSSSRTVSAWTGNAPKPKQQAIKVSMVASCHQTKTADVDLHSILNAIREGRWRKQIEGIRGFVSVGDTEEAGKLKQALPAITPSGKFRERKKEALIHHSGVICADLDKLGDNLAAIRRKIERLPQVRASFISPSGTGLKVFVRVRPDPSLHQRSFRAVEKLLLNKIGIQIDQSGKDFRACVTCRLIPIFITTLTRWSLSHCPSLRDHYGQSTPMSIFQRVNASLRSC